MQIADRLRGQPGSSLGFSGGGCRLQEKGQSLARRALPQGHKMNLALQVRLGQGPCDDIGVLD
jgi:hypothetical protein